jgi:hypothetical protein
VLWFSIAAALLAVAGNLIALAVPRIYAGLTPTLLPVALAQDIANLGVAAPALPLLAALALRGSLRAYPWRWGDSSGARHADKIGVTAGGARCRRGSSSYLRSF